ncbi:Hypothetical protein R9X50_00061100 [Acrodontium crateriforme]|uniref:HCP-like protein n=1 Tax=Acrodontium crateriforme TaxID=150365 RepID=A0AAQ3R254_9PEZI|nr:Hypothetical protein R9X50_00061100 [Acrodontium crateriforme]
MTGLKDILKKKEKVAGEHIPENELLTSPPPQIRILRTTTESEEVVEAPDYPDAPNDTPSTRERKRLTLGFRKSSNASFTKDSTAIQEHDSTLSSPVKSERRFSDMFHRHGRTSRSTSQSSSAFLPEELPAAPTSITAGADAKDGEIVEKDTQEQREAQWEKRATILAQNNPLREVEQQQAGQEEETRAQHAQRKRSRNHSPSISNARGDNNIQEAIRLHEIGELTLSTAMFGRLADPKGENIALAQVLYGLALRHGWGYPPDPEKAIHYLSLAAANSASIEEQALASGLKKGGAAKGELVLAIFELANCFRFGWGVKKDPAAARQYFETAANLGDTDAMDAAAWCYTEGFGGAKDKFKAAQYLRLAEEKGVKSVGNSWIWKEKYNPK